MREILRRYVVEIDKLEKQGHTRHCGWRQVWGDGECECGADDAREEPEGSGEVKKRDFGLTRKP